MALFFIKLLGRLTAASPVWLVRGFCVLWGRLIGVSSAERRHLANMMGTLVVVVFGPTNPVRTGPIFDAPKHILQPAGCPGTGGAAIEGVSAERVLAAVLPSVEGSAE